jgi:DNA-binding PadR family transcriptional regulator
MQGLLRDRHIGAVVKLRGGSLYDAIARCHQAGLIEPVDRNRAGARPERTVYRLTDAGQKTLKTLVNRYVGTVGEEFPEFPAGLAHLLHLDRDEATARLHERRRSLVARVAETEAALAGAREAGIPRVVLLETEYAQLLRHTEITWLSEITRAIEDGDLPWLSPETASEEK